MIYKYKIILEIVTTHKDTKKVIDELKTVFIMASRNIGVNTFLVKPHKRR